MTADMAKNGSPRAASGSYELSGRHVGEDLGLVGVVKLGESRRDGEERTVFPLAQATKSRWQPNVGQYKNYVLRFFVGEHQSLEESV